jgi:hypothetical protein
MALTGFILLIKYEGIMRIAKHTSSVPIFSAKKLSQFKSIGINDI